MTTDGYSDRPSFPERPMNSMIPIFLVLSLFASAGERVERTLKGADQVDLKLVILEPDEPAKKVGTCILLPPGPGNQAMVSEVERTLGKGFAKRNWRVVIPQAPKGASFFGKESKHIIALLSRMGQEKALLAGVSNGGISALEVAAKAPQNVKGLVVVPGILRNSKIDTAKLRGIPIFLRVGANDDLGWAKAFKTTNVSLEKSGAKLDAKLLAKTRHVFRVNWKDLDRWLAELP